MGNSLVSVLDAELRTQMQLGKGSLRNQLTALNRIQSCFGAAACDALVTLEGAEALRDRLTEVLRAEGKSDATIRSARSELMKLAKTTRSLFTRNVPREAQAGDDGQPSQDGQGTTPVVGADDLRERMAALNLKKLTYGQAVELALQEFYRDVTLAGKTGPELSKSALAENLKQRSNGVISAARVMRALREKDEAPQNVTEPLLQTTELLERFLLLPQGALLSRVPMESVEPETKYQQAERYALLPEELPPHLEQQWSALVDFYANGYAPLTQPVFGKEAMKARPAGAATWGRKDVDGEATNPSAGRYLNAIRAFFGWLHRECGVALDDLDLSIIAHKGLYGLFHRFLEERGIGYSVLGDIYILTAKIYKEPNSYGSLYLVPKPFNHASPLLRQLYPFGLPQYDSLAEWEADRAVLMADVKAARDEWEAFVGARKENNETVEIGGDSNIDWVLESEGGVEHAVETHFLGIIRKLFAESKDVARNGAVRADSCLISALFYCLLFVRPLRVSNYATMLLLDAPCTNVGRLTKESCWLDKGGDFNVYIPKHRLKNKRGGEVEAIHFTINKRDPFYPIVKAWIKRRAEILSEVGSEDTKELLVGTTAKGRGRKMYTINTDKGSQTATVQVATRFMSKYFYSAALDLYGREKAQELGIERGINPHAMRHVMAHYLLEKTSYDYQFVAHILMDGVEQVIKTYGKNKHVRQAQKYDRIRAEQAEAFARFR